MIETIGVIGVGNMGSAYARNLVDAGYDVIVYDVVDEKISRAVDGGARRGTSSSDVATQSDAVVSSVPTAEAVETVYFDDGGVLEAADSGTLLLEMSTTRPTLSDAINEAAVELGLEYVDAPVIGLPFVAEAAELVVIMGGTDESVDRAKPILAELGKELHHVGGAGDGHRAKLMNNMVLLAEYAIAAEVFALAGEMGVDREKLLGIITGGMAGSETIEVKVGKALEGDFDTAEGFAVNLARKDLEYALDMSYAADFTTPITAIVNEHYTLAATTGRGDDDYAVTMRVLEDLAGD